MSYGTTAIDPGATPTVAIARDTVAAAIYQRMKLADGTEDSALAVGTEANPLKVKPARRGTSDYDSGLVAVTNGAATSVTTATIYPEGATISNSGTAAREVTLTNTANTTIAIFSMEAKTVLQLPVPFSGSWVGLKAGADGTLVVLHVAGRQA